jgi:hypothetical protein
MCLVNTDGTHLPRAVLTGWDGPGIEFRWGEIFRTVQTSPGAHPVSFTMGSGFLYWGVKRPGRGVNHPPPSSAEV